MAIAFSERPRNRIGTAALGVIYFVSVGKGNSEFMIKRTLKDLSIGENFMKIG